MAAKTTISLEEFLKLPEAVDDGTHYELDEGELITLSTGGAVNSKLAAIITVYLSQILDPLRFDVLTGEPGVILSDEPDKSTVRGADVAVLPARPLEELPEGFTREPLRSWSPLKSFRSRTTPSISNARRTSIWPAGLKR